MNATDVRQCLLQQFDLRIEPEMSEYILRQLNSAAGSVPVIGGDARTGAPIRKIIPAQNLRAGISVLRAL
jgi:hypothetical protein